MTWYWWTHWFWITSLSATILASPISSVDSASPLKIPTNHGKGYNKREPLKFPLAVQSDSDDIFDGGINGGIAGLGTDWFQVQSSSNTDDDRWMNPPSDKIQPRSPSSTSTSTVSSLIGNSNQSNSNNTINNRTLSEDEEASTSTVITETSAEKINFNNINNLTKSSNLTTLYSSAEATDLSNKTENSIPDLSETLGSRAAVDDNDDSTNPSSNTTTSDSNTNIELTSNSFLPQNETVDDELVIHGNDSGNDVSLESSRKSKVLTEYTEEIKVVNITAETKNLLARSAAVSVASVNELDIIDEDDNLDLQAFSAQRANALDAGAISGICFSVLGIFCGISIAGAMLYRRRYINKPQTLSEPDSSGYIDDSTIRDNSDEMYSLDNDSFLNSLEAMTIQNYWTDNVKHTKL